MKVRTYVNTRQRDLAPASRELLRLASGAPYVRLRGPDRATIAAVTFEQEADALAFADELRAAYGAQGPAPGSPVPAGWRLHKELPPFSDSSAWIVREPAMDSMFGLAGSKPENVLVENGRNIIRIKRERVTVGATTREFSCGMVCTFSYGYGAAGNPREDGAWPPAKVLNPFPTPHRIEVPMRLPRLPGFWGGAWEMAVDQRRSTVGVPELDFGEVRYSAGRHDAHQHLWKWDAALGKPVDVSSWSGVVANPLDLAVERVYWCEVYADRVVYGVDGTRGPIRAQGRQALWGLIIHGGIGVPGSWGAAGGQPDPDDPGPWDVVVGTPRVLVPA